MNTRVVVGVILLVIAGAILYLWPALVISDGTQTILWGNIVPGIVLAILGIVLLAWGLMRKKGSA